jgi:hypothetical protein
VSKTIHVLTSSLCAIQLLLFLWLEELVYNLICHYLLLPNFARTVSGHIAIRCPSLDPWFSMVLDLWRKNMPKLAALFKKHEPWGKSTSEEIELWPRWIF